MGLNPLPQYKLYWHQNDFIGNSRVKTKMTCRRYQKLTHYLHYLIGLMRQFEIMLIMTYYTRFAQCSTWYKRVLLKATSLDKIKQLMKA